MPSPTLTATFRSHHLKINLDIDAKPEEIIELITRLTNPIEPSFAHAKENSYAERAKPSPSDRQMMRALYRATMSKGMKPSPPLPGLTWEDFYDPHELDENGPIIELFVSEKEIAYNKKKDAAKRLARKKS